MDKTIGVVSLMLLMWTSVPAAQALSPKWEELTASDFVKALEASGGTCTLPFGIVEKHGPAGPLGSDLINVRYTTLLAARENTRSFFPYYFGQILRRDTSPGRLPTARTCSSSCCRKPSPKWRAMAARNPHRQRPRWEQPARDVLRADAAGIVQGLHRLRVVCARLGSRDFPRRGSVPPRRRWSRRRRRDRERHGIPSRACAPGTIVQRVGGRLESVGAAGGCVHRDWVVRTIPEPLRGRFGWRHRGTRPGIDERDSSPHRERAPRHQTRRNWSQTSEGVLRQDAQAGVTMKDQRPTTNDQRRTTNDERPMTDDDEVA